MDSAAVRVPDGFLRKVCGAIDIALPPAGEYGAGLVFLPRDVQERNACQQTFQKIVREEGQQLLGWRTVPVDDSKCGRLARQNLPEIRMVFVGKGARTPDQATLERKLFVIRKRVEHAIAKMNLNDGEYFYVPSLSSRKCVCGFLIRGSGFNSRRGYQLFYHRRHF